MLQKIFAIVLIVCGLALFFAGIANHWPRHIVVGLAIFLVGMAVIFLSFVEDAPRHDERTGRYYRFARDSDNPHHAPCPKCDRNSRIIYTAYGPRHYGIYCAVHGAVWSDLDQPIMLSESNLVRLKTARPL